MSPSAADGPTTEEARRELTLLVTSRSSGRLGPPLGMPAREPSADEVAAACGSASGCWLAGGEPTLREDLPELIAALRAPGRAIGLETDGQRLADERAAARLRDAGLAAVRIALHSAHADAHDFVSGTRGSAPRAVRAMAACRSVGLRVEAWMAVTRQTTPHLAETVEVLSRLGIRQLVARRVSADRVAPAGFRMLSPRFALAAADLSRLVRTGERLGVAVAVRGFPPCVLRQPGGSRGERSDAAPAAVVMDPTTGVRAAPVVECCRLCDARECPGAPADYVSAFGWEEFALLAGARDEPPSEAEAERPATDVTVAFCAPAPVRCPSCAAPVAGSAEPAREARRRLIAAARSGGVLRIVGAGSLLHPNAVELLTEALGLGCDRVELAVEGAALARLSDGELEKLSGIAALDVALFGPSAAVHDQHCGNPGSFAAALQGLTRAARLRSVSIGSFAVLHEAGLVRELASAWARQQLPGRPRFRLSSVGGSLDELASVARTLHPPEARSAITRLLPACLAAEDAGASTRTHVASSWRDRSPGVFGIRGGPAFVAAGVDPRGRFEPCPNAGACAAAADCCGIAEGWTTSGTRPLQSSEVGR
jgi:MoaA/NifB/PqqE/SkfB family radical SAM enzyme